MQENKFCLNFCDSLYPTWDCSNTAETTKHYVLQPQFTRMEANPANTKNIRANFEDAYMFDKIVIPFSKIQLAIRNQFIRNQVLAPRKRFEKLLELRHLLGIL